MSAVMSCHTKQLARSLRSVIRAYGTGTVGTAPDATPSVEEVLFKQVADPRVMLFTKIKIRIISKILCHAPKNTGESLSFSVQKSSPAPNHRGGVASLRMTC
jgi:hypothetical protein